MKNKRYSKDFGKKKKSLIMLAKRINYLDLIRWVQLWL